MILSGLLDGVLRYLLLYCACRVTLMHLSELPDTAISMWHWILFYLYELLIFCELLAPADFA